MVIVGTKCEESALVEILFSCCCRWFFPITSPAVHELVRKVTMAEHTATMRYLMNAFIFGFIRFSCPLFTFRLLFLKEEREGLVSGLGVEVDNLMHSGLSYPEYLPDAFFHFSNWRNIFLQLGK